MKYVFPINKFLPTEKPHVFQLVTFEVFAKTAEEAYAKIEHLIPEGHRVVFWHERPSESCTSCGGPFHPVTGHWVSDRTHWCGPCTRDFIAFIKQHTSRRWGKVRFYDHATVPVGDTSKEDLQDVP
jgi:hypothetical protein